MCLLWNDGSWAVVGNVCCDVSSMAGASMELFRHNITTGGLPAVH